jgi:hypothetical protein
MQNNEESSTHLNALAISVAVMKKRTTQGQKCSASRLYAEGDWVESRPGH